MSERSFSVDGANGGVWPVAASLDAAAPSPAESPAVYPMREARQLLVADASAAERQARDWLARHPADSDAIWVVGAALRRLGHREEARSSLETLAASQPQMSHAWRELGLVCAELGDRQRACEFLRHAIGLNWFDREAWLALGETIDFADTGRQEQFPSVARAFAEGRYASAVPAIEVLLAPEPANAFLRAAKGLALAWSRRFDEGIAELSGATRECVCGPGVWLEFARLLRATNDDRAASAFAESVALLPSFSEAYVGLANSKSIRIDEPLVEKIRHRLAQAGLPAEDRARFCYVLGKGLEDLGRHAESFAAYRESNEILKRLRGSGAGHSDLYLRDATAFFTKEFFVTRGSAGSDAESPIFIVGMPRSGSTLVEQILASHSQVESLGEIPNLTDAGQRFAPGRPGDPGGGYPRVLQYLDGAGFRRMGEEYIRSTLSRRRTDRPFFTDKLPGNFCHVGMIELALPNAHIIDVRRHPLDCCLSCYKHYFPAGHVHALDLADIGRFYANYVALMAHFDAVLPGRVYRLVYEDLVENPELEVRRLLDHIGLSFEEACLRFYETRRPVLTFSADQVRQPLFHEGIGRWRHYEAQLDPLKRALGDVLDSYPAVPEFASTPARPPVSGPVSSSASFVRGLRNISFETAAPFAVAPATPASKVQ